MPINALHRECAGDHYYLALKPECVVLRCVTAIGFYMDVSERPRARQERA